MDDISLFNGKSELRCSACDATEQPRIAWSGTPREFLVVSNIKLCWRCATVVHSKVERLKELDGHSTR